MAFSVLKKLAVAIALIDLLLAVNDSRNVGRFFLLLTASGTFDLVPDNIIHKHCELEILHGTDGICINYAESLMRKPVSKLLRGEIFLGLQSKTFDTSNISIFFEQQKKEFCGKFQKPDYHKVLEKSFTEKVESYRSVPNFQTESKSSINSHNLNSARHKRESVLSETQNMKEFKIFSNPIAEALLNNGTIQKDIVSDINSGGSSKSASNFEKRINRTAPSIVTKSPHRPIQEKTPTEKSYWRLKSQKDHSTLFNGVIEDDFERIKQYPRKVTRLLEDEMLLRWTCLMETIQSVFDEKNISSSSPEAEKIKLQIEYHPFKPDVSKDSNKRLRAAQQLMFDYPWHTMSQIHSKLPGTFTRVFMVITIYTWVWGSVIALMLLIGTLTDDQTTLHGWIIFNILYSLLLFMVDDWIQTNITPVRSSASVWLFLIYSIYKPAAAWIGFTQWSEAKKGSYLKETVVHTSLKPKPSALSQQQSQEQVLAQASNTGVTVNVLKADEEEGATP